MVNNVTMNDSGIAQLDLSKIINDEKWYEGERRHCETYPDDIEVKKNVYKIIDECKADIKTKRLFDKFTLL